MAYERPHYGLILSSNRRGVRLVFYCRTSSHPNQSDLCKQVVLRKEHAPCKSNKVSNDVAGNSVHAQQEVHKMKIFVAGGTGAIGRPLLARFLAKGHSVVALMRSTENAQALVEQGIEPAIADVFDPDAVKAVV